MNLSIFLNSLLQRLRHPRWPMLLYAAIWTCLLTLTVAIASFSPELAFVSAISPDSRASKECSESFTHDVGSVSLPLDIPSENLCFSARLFKRSDVDMVVPPVFAALVVAGSACVVKALGLWEADDDDEQL